MIGKPLILFREYAAGVVFSATDSRLGTDPDRMRYMRNESRFWMPADLVGAKTVLINLGAAELIKWVAYGGEFMNGVTVEVRGSNDDFAVQDVQLLAPTVLSALANSAFVTVTEGIYSDIKHIFTGFSSGFQVFNIAHALDPVTLNFLQTDWDPDGAEPEGEHLISAGGNYVGSSQKWSKRPINVDIGQVVDAQYALILPFARYAGDNLAPIYFVPDRDDSVIYFGWSKGFKAPRSAESGLRTVQPFTLITRAV